VGRILSSILRRREILEQARRAIWMGVKDTVNLSFPREKYQHIDAQNNDSKYTSLVLRRVCVHMRKCYRRLRENQS
jgi:hypothetical protein